MTVADRLAHGDDIRDDALRLESPPMAADPAEADLHLVGDADAAGLPNHAVDVLEVAVRQKHLACDARNGFGEEETWRFASGAHRRDQLGHVFAKRLPCCSGGQAAGAW